MPKTRSRRRAVAGTAVISVAQTQNLAACEPSTSSEADVVSISDHDDSDEFVHHPPSDRKKRRKTLQNAQQNQMWNRDNRVYGIEGDKQQNIFSATSHQSVGRMKSTQVASGKGILNDREMAHELISKASQQNFVTTQDGLQNSKCAQRLGDSALNPTAKVKTQPTKPRATRASTTKQRKRKNELQNREDQSDLNGAETVRDPKPIYYTDPTVIEDFEVPGALCIKITCFNDLVHFSWAKFRPDKEIWDVPTLYFCCAMSDDIARSVIHGVKEMLEMKLKEAKSYSGKPSVLPPPKPNGPVRTLGTKAEKARLEIAGSVYSCWCEYIPRNPERSLGPGSVIWMELKYTSGARTAAFQIAILEEHVKARGDNGVGFFAKWVVQVVFMGK